MNLLAIESSSRKLSVGLMKQDSFSELHSKKINDTANSLPLLSKKIINNASLSYENLDAICISSGPGSFTGLRVGMSYAKGIAMALDIPIVPVSTFDSLAYKNTSEKLSTLIYSHGSTFYICEYSTDNGILLKSSQPKSILKENVFFTRWCSLVHFRALASDPSTATNSRYEYIQDIWKIQNFMNTTMTKQKCWRAHTSARAPVEYFAC